MIDNDVVLAEGDEPAAPRTNGPVISSGTRLAGGLMLLALLVCGVLDYLAATGIVPNATNLTLAALTLVPLVVALIILPVARSFAAGVIRTQWLLFGFGMLSVGVGNVIFIILYVASGKDPYPSVADVFTLTGYAFFAAGLLLAVRAYRGLVSIRQPMIIAAGLAAAAMALVYFTVIGPYVVFAPAESQSMATRVFNTLYPVLDTLVLLMPAVSLGLVVGKLGKGRVAWPWWFVVLSVSILAVTDTVFAYATYVGTGRTPLIDSGYALAPMLLGFAVLVARDVYKT